MSLPAALVAIILGRFLNHQLSGHTFFRLVFAGLIALGAILIAQGLSTVADELHAL